MKTLKKTEVNKHPFENINWIHGNGFHCLFIQKWPSNYSLIFDPVKNKRNTKSNVVFVIKNEARVIENRTVTYPRGPPIEICKQIPSQT